MCTGRHWQYIKVQKHFTLAGLQVAPVVAQALETFKVRKTRRVRDTNWRQQTLTEIVTWCAKGAAIFTDKFSWLSGRGLQEKPRFERRTGGGSDRGVLKKNPVTETSRHPKDSANRRAAEDDVARAGHSRRESWRLTQWNNLVRQHNGHETAEKQDETYCSDRVTLIRKTVSALQAHQWFAKAVWMALKAGRWKPTHGLYVSCGPCEAPLRSRSGG